MASGLPRNGRVARCMIGLSELEAMTMKQLLAMALIAAVCPAWATKYFDAAGDCNAPMTTYGNANVDLLSLEIVTDLEPVTDTPRITFTFTTNSANIQDPGWIKLVMAIRGPALPGDVGVNSGPSTGWPRLFNIAGGSDRWIGGWVDGAFGGFEARLWNGTDFGAGSPAGATWQGTPGMLSTITGNQAIYQCYLSTLGLQLGDSFVFEATTTGGDDDDGAWDPLSMIQGQITAPDQQMTTSGNLLYRTSTNNNVQTISGTLALNDTSDEFAMPRNIQVLAMEGDNVVGTAVVSTSAPSAPFSIDVPVTALNNNFRLVLDGASFLKRTIPVTLSGSNQSVAGTVVMQNGDVDEDGEVTLNDVDLVIGAYGQPGGTTSPFYDVDVDGEVGLNDIDIVIANYQNGDN